jgi:AcrR family transcriptional regulator
MDSLPYKIKISINAKIFIRDPETTELGRKIISSSIDLIDEIGYEKFTFKKLGAIIDSPESTIYRYFENKHKLLLYLHTWYWGWLEFRVLSITKDIADPKNKLIDALSVITGSIEQDEIFSHVDEVKLNHIITTESSKVYHTKNVDVENQEGYYVVYKRLVQRMSDIIIAYQPKYSSPHTLISTVIEGARQQRFFAEHLPRMTDIKNPDKDITKFYTDLVIKIIEG